MVASRRLVWLFTGLACGFALGESASAEVAAGAQRQGAGADSPPGLRLEYRLPGSWSATTGRGLLHNSGATFAASFTGRSADRMFRDGAVVGSKRALVPDQQEASRSRSRLYWSTALALTGAAVAYWSKSAADDAYDSYLRAAGTERQRDRFARAKGYDRVSGASFIAMEVGIALSTYLLFFGS